MTVSISLDHHTFEAGSVLMGAIFITREKSLSAKGLRLLFKGEERVRVIDKETKRSCDEDFLFHEYAEEVKEVINRGKIKSGKYIVPFKIRIPDELPQTVTIPWTHVSYIVACELEDRQGHKEELASSRVNILAKPILHEPSPFRREPFVEFVRKNRFLSGYFAITMEISDTTVEPGEEVAVSVAIRNRSPLKILKVKALLKEEVFSRAAQNERVADKVLAFHEFKVYRATGRKRSKWLRGSDPMEDCDEIEVELEYEEHQGTLRVPKNSTLTYAGKLLDVKQALHLEIQTELNDPIDIHIVPINLRRKLFVPVETAASDGSSEYEYPTQDPGVQQIG